MELKAEVELPIPQSAANVIVSGVELLKIIDEHGRLDAEVIHMLENARSIAENGNRKLFCDFLVQVLNEVSKNIYIAREMIRIRLERNGRNGV